MKERISPKDWILLSSYMDDELDPRQKARVEARLQARPELREGLAELQRTKEILRRAPARRAPRNFTLPASMAVTRPGLSLRLVPALRLSSAVVALAAVFFMVSTLMSGSFFGPQMASAPADMNAKEMTTLQMESAPAQAEGEASPPPVVYWGGPPVQQAYGQGGGDCPDGRCGGAADSPPYAGGLGGSPEGGYVPQPMIMATQPAEAFKAQPTPAPALLPTPTSVPAAEAQEQPVEGTGPILGVAPMEQQGEALEETHRQVLPMVAAEAVKPAGEERGLQRLPYGAIGAGLLVLAAALFITALILRRNALR